MSYYYLEPKSLGWKVKVQLDLSDCAIRTDLKNSTAVHTSSFAKKTDLGHLKSHVDKLDINKLKNVPRGLSSLKSKVDKWDVDKLVPVPVELIELKGVVKRMLLTKMHMMLRSKILKINLITLWQTLLLHN